MGWAVAYFLGRNRFGTVDAPEAATAKKEPPPCTPTNTTATNSTATNSSNTTAAMLNFLSVWLGDEQDCTPTHANALTQENALVQAGHRDSENGGLSDNEWEE